MARKWNKAHFNLGLTLAAILSMTLASCGPAHTVHDKAPAHPTATPQPTPTPHPPNAFDYYGLSAAQQATVNWYLQHMTLDEKLGQLMLIETYYTSYTPDVDTMVRGLHVGAMIVYKKNMLANNPSGPATLRGYLKASQDNARIPLLMTMDEEGGGVDRLGDLGYAPPLQSPLDTAKTGNPQNAFADGQKEAKVMLSYGLNTNLAPLADIRGPSTSILYTRMYGTDPQTVINYASQFVQGSEQSGVIATLKHWPGAGGLNADPHHALPVSMRTKAELEGFEWATFRTLLAQKPGMIMVTHVEMQGLDSKYPATLSPIVVQGILRDEMHYEGVVMTDSLWMQGIAINYSLPQAAVLSIEAGDDLLEGAYDSATTRAMINALSQAVTSGQITQARIDQSVMRILALKAAYGILPVLPAAATPSPSGTVTHG